MKKLLKFNNLIALLGIICILLYLTPCFEIKSTFGSTYLGWVNLFTGTFGGKFGFADYPDYQFVLCGGLLVAFIFAVLGILFSFARNKFKIASIAAVPFYLTSGILLCCSRNLVYYSNINISMGSGFTFNVYPWVIVIAVVLIVLAAFSLIDFVIAIAKPKQQPVY